MPLKIEGRSGRTYQILVIRDHDAACLVLQTMQKIRNGIFGIGAKFGYKEVARVLDTCLDKQPWCYEWDKLNEMTPTELVSWASRAVDSYERTNGLIPDRPLWRNPFEYATDPYRVVDVLKSERPIIANPQPRPVR